LRSRVCRSFRAFQARAKRVTRSPRRDHAVGAAQRPTNRGSGRVRRAIAGFLGLLLLFVLEPEILRFTDWGQARAVARGRIAHALVLSEQARRFLLLQYQSYPTEFMGCMIGEFRGSAIVVERIAPADVDPPKSARTHVIPKASCEASGWSHTVGMIHSHPGGEKCWYYFPGTQVATSDRQSFLMQPYPIDAIMCGNEVVWIGRDYKQQQIPVVANE
jgi:JAB domain-containing protein similar to deubiquitination enzymes